MESKNRAAIRHARFFVVNVGEEHFQSMGDPIGVGSAKVYLEAVGIRGAHHSWQLQKAAEDTASILGALIARIETQSEHSLSVTGGQFQRVDQQAAILAEERACLVGLLGGDLAGRMAQAVFHSAQNLAFLGDLAPKAGVSDFQAASGGVSALVVVVQRAAREDYEPPEGAAVEQMALFGGTSLEAVDTLVSP